jgi:hypothetical protein
MSVVNPPSGPPVTSVKEAIARMELIGAALPATDGLACFNRIYLDITRHVDESLQQNVFADPVFMSHLDVTFVNIYFDAVDSVTTQPTAVPGAWAPLVEARSVAGIEPIQFAFAGMNAHINHDLPLAVVMTCADLATAPEDASHHDDYQKVNQLLDAAEQSIRQSFESGLALAVDHHLQAVANLVSGWSIIAAREVAWTNALALWEMRDRPIVRDLLTQALARTVAMASRGLLAVV